MIEQLVAGADRILFGATMPLTDPRPQLGKIIPAEANRLILDGNVRRLLE